jgi:hypothetical protein
MPETKTITFSHKEIAEALIKYHDLHEGLWGLYIEFGLAAANVGPEPGGDLLPTAIIPVKKIGLQRFQEFNNLTVDAAEVNPLSKTRIKKK